MKKLLFFLLLGTLFILNSCEDSINSLEDSRLSEDGKEFVTFKGPDGKVVEKAVPDELRKSNEVAQSRSGYPCTMKVKNLDTNDWAGVSVDGSNLIVPAGNIAYEDCPCANQGAYVWLVTFGPGINWWVYKDGGENDPAEQEASGILPNNGAWWTYY